MVHKIVEVDSYKRKGYYSGCEIVQLRFSISTEAALWGEAYAMPKAKLSRFNPAPNEKPDIKLREYDDISVRVR